MQKEPQLGKNISNNSFQFPEQSGERLKTELSDQDSSDQPGESQRSTDQYQQLIDMATSASPASGSQPTLNRSRKTSEQQNSQQSFIDHLKFDKTNTENGIPQYFQDTFNFTESDSRSINAVTSWKLLSRNQKYKGFRQYLIRRIFLGQFHRRPYLDNIHCLYDLDFKGAFTDNRLGLIVKIIYATIMSMVVWFVYQLWNNRHQSFTKNVLEEHNIFMSLLLLKAGIPLVLTIFSFTTLMVNYCCCKGREETKLVYSWQLKSIGRLISSLTYSICLVLSLMEASDQSRKYKDLKQFIELTFEPLVVFACCTLATMFFLQFRNSRWWFVISISILSQYILSLCDLPDSYLVVPSAIILLTQDLFYLMISIQNDSHNYLEFPLQNEETREQMVTDLYESSLGQTQSRGGSISSAYKSKQHNHLSQIGFFKSQDKGTTIFFRWYLIMMAVCNLLCSLSIIAAGSDLYHVNGYQKGPFFNTCWMIKLITLVPFITFEYYLILFEHLFVDASHFGSIFTQSLYANIQTSPNGSVSYTSERLKRILNAQKDDTDQDTSVDYSDLEIKARANLIDRFNNDLEKSGNFEELRISVDRRSTLQYKGSTDPSFTENLASDLEKSCGQYIE